jgi:pre-mRNA-splicing factor CDC5/CEF1
MSEARNLRNMVQAQTPLLGDENTPLHEDPRGGTGFEGATPRHQVAFTPNPLATPLRGPGGMDPSATPISASVSGTPLRTPVRDNLRINPDDGFSTVGDTPREQRMRNLDVKRALKAGFSSLPKPANDYEVLVPEDEDEDNDAGNGVMTEEDAAERDARNKRKKEEEERRALARRTIVVRLGLPRPANVDINQLLTDLTASPEVDDEFASAKQLIDVELVKLMQHDSIAHPIPGTSRPGATQSYYEHPDDSDMATAKADIHKELATLLGYPQANEETVKKGVIALAQNEVIDDTISWACERERLVYDAKARSWVDPTTISLEARLAGASALLEQDRETMAKEASRASKIEKKLNLVLGGFQMRASALTKRATDAFAELQRTEIDLESFARLHVNESATAPRRVEALKEEVEKLERRERTLQARYQELQELREEAQLRVAAAEERLMTEAEAMNEEALQADETE